MTLDDILLKVRQTARIFRVPFPIRVSLKAVLNFESPAGF